MVGFEVLTAVVMKSTILRHPFSHSDPSYASMPDPPSSPFVVASLDDVQAITEMLFPFLLSAKLPS
jgi:hypothetical protein